MGGTWRKFEKLTPSPGTPLPLFPSSLPRLHGVDVAAEGYKLTLSSPTTPIPKFFILLQIGFCFQQPPLHLPHHAVWLSEGLWIRLRLKALNTRVFSLILCLARSSCRSLALSHTYIHTQLNIQFEGACRCLEAHSRASRDSSLRHFFQFQMSGSQRPSSPTLFLHRWGN